MREQVLGLFSDLPNALHGQTKFLGDRAWRNAEGVTADQDVAVARLMPVKPCNVSDDDGKNILI